MLAQGTSASISGAVMDETGGVIPGVTVIVTNLNQGTSRTLVSDDEGRYRAPALVLGTYEVKGELVGFQTFVRSGIELTVGRNAVVDLTMSVGSIAEQVTVTGEASLVDTTEGTLGQLITQQQVLDLPLNGRDLIQLMTLEAAAINYQRGSQNNNIHGGYGINLVVAGARERSNSYLLDGADLIDHRGKLPGSVAGVQMGVDSLQEFQVMTSNFSAEYGRAGGGVITAVTKSGTNEFHGSLYEFHRNDVLDATNFFNNKNGIEKSPLRQNQFGGSVGGPIIKDRTFFFANYEGITIRSGQVLVDEVPTAEAKQGIIPVPSSGTCPNFFPFDAASGKCVIDAPGFAPGVVPTGSAPYMDLWPLPNVAGQLDFGDGTGLYTEPWSQPINGNYFVTKIDHNINDAHSIFGRYNIDYADNVQGFNTNVRVLNESKLHYMTLEEKWIVSPTLLNVIRYSLVRRHETRADDLLTPIIQDSSLWHVPNAEKLGALWVGRVLLRPSQNDDSPRKFTQNLFHFTDNVTYNRGSHSFKFGFDHKRYQYNAQSASRFGGRWDFRSFEEFTLSGPARSVAVLTPDSDSIRGLRQSVISFFLQDDLQLLPNLSVNLGLRYEFITVPDEVNGKLFNMRKLSDRDLIQVGGDTGEPYFRNPSLRNWAPRIGFAWDISGDGKTAIRGAFGMFYDQIQLSLFQQPVFAMPPTTQVVINNAPYPDPFANGTPDPGRNRTVYIFPDNGMNNPYLMKWNLNIQREIVPGTVATVGYIGSRGVNLLGLDQYSLCNPEYVGGTTDGQAFHREGCQVRSDAFLRIESRTGTRNSFYHGAVLKVNRRFSDGIALQGAYTYSRSIDDQSQSGNGGISNTFVGTIDFPDIVRGLSDFDVRHSLTVNGSWIPPGPTGGGVAQAVLGGWQINGIVNLATGNPLTVDMGRSWSFDRSPSGKGRPNLIAGESNSPVVGDGRDPDNYFDPSSFGVPAHIDDPSVIPGCGPAPNRCSVYGDLGRNTLIGPGVATFDLSLTKDFLIPQMGEQGNLQFRAEFFNIFNRANFNVPRLQAFSSSGRAVGSAGVISSTMTTERQVQLALKLTF
jgi:outer membrane receptor protein involved in Fe transport